MSAPSASRQQSPSLPPLQPAVDSSQLEPSDVETAVPDSAPRPPRKRPFASRPIISCEECRRRKIGCSKKPPCESCMRFGRKCVFVDQGNVPERSSHSTLKVDRHSETAGGKPYRSSYGSDRRFATPSQAQQTSWLPQNEIGPGWGSLRPQQISGSDFELAMDNNCLQIGKLSITQRIVGVSRLELVDFVSSFRTSKRSVSLTTNRLAQPSHRAMATP